MQKKSASPTPVPKANVDHEMEDLTVPATASSHKTNPVSIKSTQEVQKLVVKDEDIKYVSLMPRAFAALFVPEQVSVHVTVKFDLGCTVGALLFYYCLFLFLFVLKGQLC